MYTTLPGTATLVFPAQTLEVTDAMLSFCGCTDPNAENYNPDAKKDNGSCYYINLPSNLNYTINNAANSGLVEVTATAANENFFTFVF